ncbi:MAG: integrase [Rhodoferax sp.]
MRDHTKIESAESYLGIEVEDSHEMAELTDI